MAESLTNWVIGLAQKSQVKIASKAFVRLTDYADSPVYTGSYVNSMRVSKGEIDPSVTLINRRSNGQLDLAVGGSGSGSSKMKQIKFRKGEIAPIFVSNSLPYAITIEDGGTATKPTGKFFKLAAMSAVGD